ncbi:MAG: hypothetical protein QGF74_02015 [Candidatus Nanoarchaeia archaeon]|jgi:hypothetical protein|nr:hypothetical protein [Candidatus Nanoarchaeia archaeon]|tara:strand:+ start:44920 stop:46131 length:1212 start_codon:yes stop_codon:yes gene_type:complete
MQERVTKAVITASYNDDGKESPIRDKVMYQAQKEREKGYKFLNHLILRDTKDHRVTKFNLLLAEIPIISHVLYNASRTSLEEITVVGDEVTKTNVGAFSEYFKDSRFRYVDEGPPEEWKLSETLRKGDSGGQVVLTLMGDLPLAWNLEHILHDPDIPNYDAIFDLNTKRKVGKHFPRYYHFRIRHKGVNWLAKEPNLYLMDIGKIEYVADLMYSGRKTNMGEGRWKLFEKLFIENGKWKITLDGLGKVYSAQIAFNLIAGRELLLKPEKIQKVINDLAGIKTRFKADNNQPGTLEDIDSLEDWAYIYDMLSEAKDKYYPYFSKLRKFSEDVMPELKRKHEFYYGFKDYMNSLFKEYDLLEPFVRKGVFENPFTSNKIDSSTRNRVKRMMKLNILAHGRYNRRF